MLDGTYLNSKRRMEITGTDIELACEKQVWDLGNQVLYDLCQKYPQHTEDDSIIAKVWLIGRAYAAAIERRPDHEIHGDDFYTQRVVPEIKSSPIDKWLSELPPGPPSDANVCASVIKTHGEVTKLFSRISGLSKRSLASKYLHFHRPDLFFIYDSRSMSVIRAATPPLTVPGGEDHDPEYALFFQRCLCLIKFIKERHDAELNPRQLDNLLIRLSTYLSK